MWHTLCIKCLKLIVNYFFLADILYLKPLQNSRHRKGNMKLYTENPDIRHHHTKCSHLGTWHPWFVHFCNHTQCTFSSLNMCFIWVFWLRLCSTPLYPVCVLSIQKRSINNKCWVVIKCDHVINYSYIKQRVSEQLPVMYHDSTSFITILYLQPHQDENNSAASIV